MTSSFTVVTYAKTLLSLRSRSTFARWKSGNRKNHIPKSPSTDYQLSFWDFRNNNARTLLGSLDTRDIGRGLRELFIVHGYLLHQQFVSSLEDQYSSTSKYLPPF